MKLISTALILCAAAAAASKVEPVNTSGKGLALKGYDPVAYFVLGKPEKGLPQYSHRWMGATWQFATAENRDRFASNPEQYAPQYGGYCSYAVSKGYTASIDPEAWKVVNNKLYLNYSKSVQKTWEQDVPGYIEKADRNWPGLHK